LLAQAGYRVIVPYLRGYGTTRFLSDVTLRSGQPTAVAADIVALMDALKIEKAVIGGCDWGARTANIMAVLWPERCEAMVSVSGYLIGTHKPARCRCPQRPSYNGGISSISPPSAVGRAMKKYRHDFSKLIWQTASPKWAFDDATFDRSAASFENPDHVAVVIHNYPLAAGPSGGRGEICRSGQAACRPSGHCRAHHHP